MKIAVNTRLLIKGKMDGIGFFLQETMKRMVKNHPEHQFYFLFDRKYHENFIYADNVTPIVLYPSARHPFLYFIWFEFAVAYALRRIKPDVFLSPDGYLSLNSKVPQVGVIHDLNFEYYPQDLPILESKYYRYFFPKYAKKAKRLATVSQASKLDLEKLYHKDGALIDVVYNGVKEGFAPIDQDLKQKLQEKYTQGAPYFVFVGSLHPRKNLVNLFKAFDLFKNQVSSKMKLLIVGNRKNWTDDMKATYERMKYGQDVIFTGRVSTDDLHYLVGGAEALTYISYFEGFGVPLIEAFRCHVPVISANVTSLPEIAGDAAILVDPFNIVEIAEAMNTIVNNHEVRYRLIENAIKRKDVFTWERSTDLLYNCILKAVED